MTIETFGKTARVLLAALVIAALTTFTPIGQPALAGPGDDFALEIADNLGGEALIGEEITYTITATGSQTSGAYLYNLSFRKVLPPGVSIVSADPAPSEELIDVPGPGQTTIIWENVSDLPSNSQASVQITVDTNPDFGGGTSGSGTVPVASIVGTQAEAVASLDAFSIPDYDLASGQFTAEFDGSGSATHDVVIIPFRVTKSGPGELLRGVHSNGIDGGSGTTGGLYTVEIKNNPDYATNTVFLTDTLHPGLEFLGCSSYYAADNTTVGEEWPGSGEVATGICTAPVQTPDSVDTGAGGETIVDWTLGNMAPGDIILVTYQAGIPLFANTAFSAPPAATGLTQGRNLDNNNGTSTGESDSTVNTAPELLSAGEQVFDNYAIATGTYTPDGSVGTDDDTFLTESEDIIITKDMVGALNHGTQVDTTLTVTTSEYRDFSNLVVRDLLPSSLCYLGTYNADVSAGSTDWDSNDCPGAGSVPATLDGSAGPVASVQEIGGGGPYGTGRFELRWDFADASNAALTSLASDGSMTITYSSVVRQFYRGGLAQLPAEPVLAGDSVTNEVEVSGPDVVANPAVLAPDAVDPDGGVDGDTSSDFLENEIASLNKRVSVKTGPLDNGAGTTPSTCIDNYATITWSEADPDPELGYGPGDIVCFELAVSFPGSVSYEGATVQDLLPAGYKYIDDSAARVASIDTLPSTTVVGSDAVVTFTVGDGGQVSNGGNEFRWVIAADLEDPSAGAALDINANLQKLVHNNNGGLVFQLRDQTAAEWTEPQVEIAVGIDTVNAGASNGPDFDGSLAGGSTPVVATGGDVVTYRIDVWNTGNTSALNTEIHEIIPSEFTCADISNISNGGICIGGRITWPPMDIPGSVGGGDTTPDDVNSAPITLTFDLTVPNDVDPAHVFTNTAGAAKYQAVVNTGLQDYYPDGTNVTGNIDPAYAGLENTDPADDQSFLESRAITITTDQVSGITEAGNIGNATPAATADAATIGEIIQYSITVTIPEGTTVYNGQVLDNLPAGVTWFQGMGLFNGVVSDLQPTVTSSTGDTPLTLGVLSEAGGVVTYDLPDPYPNLNSSGDDEVTITFYAIVDDVSNNTADPATVFDNSALFDYDDSTGADRDDIAANTVTMTVVEPNPAIDKIHVNPAGTEVLPGQDIDYQITVSNPSTASNVATAHDITVTDDVPAGITPLGIGGVPVTSDGDLVPTGAFFGTWSETNRTIVWTPGEVVTLDAIDPDGSVQLDYQGRINDPSVSSGALVNTASLVAFSLDQDLAPAADPNQALARQYAASDDDLVTLPLAEVEKDIEPFNPANTADDTATFTVGQTVEFQVTAIIPSATLSYDTTLFDQLPAGLTFDSFGAISVSPECLVFDSVSGTTTGGLDPADIELFSPVNGDPSLVAWFLDDVAGFGECRVTATYTTHVNQTVVAADAPTNAGSLAWNDTDIIPTAPAALPAGYDTPTSPSWVQNAGPETQTFTVTEPSVELDSDVSSVTGSGLVDPACDTTSGNNTSGSDDADGLPADGCDTTPGAELRTTLTVSSVGSSDAFDVTVVETLPAGITPLSAPGGSPVTTTGDTVIGASGSVGTWDETAHTITWLIAGSIPIGTSRSVDYDSQVDQSDSLTRGQNLTAAADVSTFYGIDAAERAQIALDNPAHEIAVYGNNGVRGPVYGDVTTVEIHFPTLTVDIASAPNQDVNDVRLDTPFNFVITAMSTNPVADAFNVDLTGVLPEGWTYVPGSATVETPYSGGPVAAEPTCSASTGVCNEATDLDVESLVWTDVVVGAAQPLSANQTVVITLSAIPQAPALVPDATIGEAHTGPANAHVATASVVGEDSSSSPSCCDPDGPGGAAPEAYADDDIEQVFIARADIEVTKTIDPTETDGDPNNGPYWLGSWVNYTISVDNLGPDAASGVAISDVLDNSELEFDAVVSIDQGTFDELSNIWTIGPMTNGASLNLTMRTRLVGLGSVTNIAQASNAEQYDSDSVPANNDPSEDDQSSVTIDVVPTSLGDFVWMDLNGDGVQDSGEPGIPDVQVDLAWIDPGTGSSLTFSTTTGPGGSWGVPPSAGLPSNTDISVTINAAASPNLAGLTQSFDRDGTLDNTSTEQITAADTVLPGGALADLDFDFGYTPDGTQGLGNAVWWDQDNSGDASDGAGEYGIDGVEVTATWAGHDGTLGTSDDLTFSTTTASGGAYSFTNLPPGIFSVEPNAAQLPAGLDTPTYDLDGVATPQSAVLTLDPGETQDDVDFSYTGSGTLGDTVWLDHNGDGIHDATEPGLGGVTVEVSWYGSDNIPGNGDDELMSTLTLNDGSYALANLPHGTYEVAVLPGTLPPGLIPTDDYDGATTPHISTVILDGATPSSPAQDFGYRGAGSIGDMIFFDVDGAEADGVPDPGDSPLVGIGVTVVWAGADATFATSDDFTISTTTDASGTYAVSDLPHGDYMVTVDPATLPDGLTASTYDFDGVASPDTSAVSLTAAAPDALNQDFAFTGNAAGDIGSSVWLDQNADGTQDPGEVGFSGVAVTATWYGIDGLPGGGDDVVQTTSTDADGNYLFDNLPEGKFGVAIDPATIPIDLVATQDGDGVSTLHTSEVTLSPAMPSTYDQDFGYSGVGSIGDTVWFDVDSSGTPDPDVGEPALAGVTVNVTWSNPQGLDATYEVVTDVDGMYLVENLPTGTYTVAIDPTSLPGGLAESFDFDGTTTPHSTVTSLDATTPTDLDQDFSYSGVGSIGDTVWFDSDADGAIDPAGTGVFDGQDQALSGIELTVVWGGFDGFVGDDPATPSVDESADDLTYPATTNPDGEWLVSGLPHGSYVVTLDGSTLPAGIEVATYDADGIATVHVSTTELDDLTPDRLDQDFSYTGGGSIGGPIWFDRDGDGVVGPDEVPLAGVSVTVSYLGPNGTLISVPAITSTDGTYLVENLPFGVAITAAVDPASLPSGQIATFDADGIATVNSSQVTLTDVMPTVLDQGFGYTGAGSIGDQIWLDRNNSAMSSVDGNDVPLAGVEVSIVWTNPTGAADMTVVATTDAAGNYLVEGLLEGDYTVTVNSSTLPAGVTPTFDFDSTTTPDTSMVVLSAGAPSDLNQDFSYAGSGSIGDTVWFDENGDGVIDPTESRLENVSLAVSYTDPATGHTFNETALTAADGTYNFLNLPAGDYVVTVDPASMPAGYAPTADLDGIDTPHVALASLGAGESQLNLDFGYRPEADLEVTITHADDFVIGGTGVWTLEVTNNGPAPAEGPIVVTHTLPDGVTFDSAGTSDWGCSAVGQIVTCTLVDTNGVPRGLAPGESASVDIAVTVSALAAIGVTSTASVSSATHDSQTGNNDNSDASLAPLSVLGVTKTLSSALTAGAEATYTVVVTNHGPSPTRGRIEVADDLPPQLSFKSATSNLPESSCAAAGQAVICTATDPLPVGATWTITLVVDVTIGAGNSSVSNSATVTGGNEVNGAQLDRATLASIYAELDDPSSPLAVALGFGQIPASATTAPATVGAAPTLSFTGASSRVLALAGIWLLAAGWLVLTMRRQRRGIARG